MRPLAILHIDTERGWRGGERQLLWLAEELARQGHRSYVAARPGEPLAARARGSALPTISCSPAGDADAVAAFRLRRAIRLLGVDLVHAHTGHAVALAALAVIGLAVPVVASRRVDIPLRRNAVSRWKYSRASALVAVSYAVRDVLLRSGVEDGRITVIHDGVDLGRRIAPAAPESLAALGVPRGAPLAVQVAQLAPEKDPVSFVRAIAAARARVPGLHGLLVGEGCERRAVERELGRQGLEGVVHLAGFRNDADSLMAAADVAVLSSRDEGLGSVLLDALMLGRPVAATSAGGIPEVVEHGVSGLLTSPGDPDALGTSIARLLTEPDARARMGAAGVERASRFSMPRTAAATLDVYHRALARRPGVHGRGRVGSA